MGFPGYLRASTFVLLIALLAHGCAEEKTMPPELAGVYGRIVEAREDYEAGIALIVDGDDVAGENLLAAASTRMLVAARECARTPGCDAGLIAASTEEMALKLAADLGEPQVPPADAADEDSSFIAEDVAVESSEIESVSLLSGASLDEVIPLNRRVQAQLNAWLTWKRPDLANTYERYSFLRHQLAPWYEEAGLPEALLFAIVATESEGKVHAYSRAGAAGPLQFMPATARRYGLGSINGFDTRLEPSLASRASARYLGDHLRHFRGNLELTLAAYNAGETRMRRIHRRYPRAAFWDPEIYYSLPSETRAYVPRVLAAALIFLRPDQYGVRFPDVESTVTEVKLGSAASLGEIAVCLGNPPGEPGWFRTLRNLNPDVSPRDRLPAGERIDLPTAAVDAFASGCAGEAPLMIAARSLHDAEYPERPEVIRYTVRRGDTLAAIAGAHRSTVKELAELNGIRPPNYVIHRGQQLTVPARQ